LPRIFIRILLKNLSDAIQFLLDEPIHRLAMLGPDENPFPEIEYSYPGIYLLQYLHRDNTPLTIEEAGKLVGQEENCKDNWTVGWQDGIGLRINWTNNEGGLGGAELLD